MRLPSRHSRRPTRLTFPIPRVAAVLIPLVLILDFLLLCVFAFFIYFYTVPSDQHVTDIAIEPDYDYGDGAYNCTPLVADDHYGLRFNYDTCNEYLNAPSTDSVVSKTIADGNIWRYYPFKDIVDTGILNPSLFSSYYHSDLADQDSNSSAIMNALKSLNDCDAQGASDSDGWSRDELLTTGPLDVYQSVSAAPPPAASGGAAGRRLRQSVTYPCAITQAQAIAMFEKFNELVDPCFFTKINSPFSCVKKGPMGIVQRVSLSYANTMLVMGLINGAIVQGFFSSARARLRKGIRASEETEAA